MELLLGAAGAAAWSAYMASVDDGTSAPPGELLRSGLRRLQAFVHPGSKVSLAGLTINVQGASIDCSCATLDSAALLRLAE